MAAEEVSLNVADLAPGARLLSPHPLLVRSALQDSLHHSFERASAPGRLVTSHGRAATPSLIQSFHRPKTATVYYSGAFNYARHNPHPRLVHHVKGFLDLPMCLVEVIDNQPLQPQVTRPCTANRQWETLAIPNVNSQNAPINTLNGLPLLPLEKGPELWREELKCLTEAVMIPLMSQRGNQDNSLQSTELYDHHPYPICRPVTALLVQPPEGLPHNNRPRIATSPPLRRCKTPGPGFQAPQHSVEELQVFQTLSQLLNAPNSSAVQTWLCTASDEEKWHALMQLNTIFQQPSKSEQQQVGNATVNCMPQTATPGPVQETGRDENQPRTSRPCCEPATLGLHSASEPSLQRLMTHGSQSSSAATQTGALEGDLLPSLNATKVDRLLVHASPPAEEDTTTRCSTSRTVRPATARLTTSHDILPQSVEASKTRPKTARSQRASNQTTCEHGVQVNLPIAVEDHHKDNNLQSATPILRYVHATAYRQGLRNPNLIRTTRNFYPGTKSVNRERTFQWRFPRQS